MSGTDTSKERIRKDLYDVLNDEELSLAGKQRQVLSLARSYLGVEHAYIQRHEPASDTDTVTCGVGTATGQFSEGTKLTRATSYCRRTIEKQSPVALSNVPEQGWADDPAYKKHQFDCYLGTTIFVAGEAYGTVCFISRDAKGREFTTDEKLFVELLARLLGRELEASEYEQQLTTKERANNRRNRLIDVLERVLRHNIRNDMTTIGGLANVIAQRTEGDIPEIAEQIEAKAANLSRLSDKARTAKEMTPATETIEPRSVVDDIEAVTGDLRQAFPDVEFRLDMTAVPYVLATDQIEIALRELGENAAKYGDGEPVTYTVSMEDEHVVVEVQDRGSGLPEHERKLLESGEETPLEHGTGLGLWLVNWIVTGFDGHVTTTVANGTTVALHLRPATDERSVVDSKNGQSLPP